MDPMLSRRSPGGQGKHAKMDSGPIYWAGIALLVAEETWIRLRIPTKSIQATLEKAIANKG